MVPARLTRRERRAVRRAGQRVDLRPATGTPPLGIRRSPTAKGGDVVTVYPLLVRPDRQLSQAEFARRSGLHPELCAAWSPSACCTRPATPGVSCGSRSASSPRSAGSSGCAPGSRSTTPRSAWSSTCSTGSASSNSRCARSAPRTMRPEGGSLMDLNRLTQKSQEALHDAQTQGAALRPHRGRRRAPAARAARPARRARAPAARREAGADAGPAARRRSRPSLQRRPRSPAPGGARRARSFVTQRLARAARRAPSGRPSGSRTSTSPSSTCSSPCSTRARAAAAGRLLHEQGLTRDAFLQALDRDPRQPAGHVGDARRAPTRRWRSTAATWSPTPAPASSTR